MEEELKALYYHCCWTFNAGSVVVLATGCTGKLFFDVTATVCKEFSTLKMSSSSGKSEKMC